MHQKRTKKLFLLTTWRMALNYKEKKYFFFVPFDYMKNGSLHKKSNFFVPFLMSSSRKERHLYFLPCQMHQKRTTKNCSFWLHEEWLSPQKEQFFCSFLNVVFARKEGHLYFLPCQMHQKRTTNCSFWLHEEWLSPQKEQFFCSFLNLSSLTRKERHLYFLPC